MKQLKKRRLIKQLLPQADTEKAAAEKADAEAAAAAKANAEKKQLKSGS